jgi:hypothetical protein
MKWKLFTRNENSRPPDEGSNQYDSEDAALKSACEIIKHQLSMHVQVLYVEGPNGERIDSPKIAEWCNARGLDKDDPPA